MPALSGWARMRVTIAGDSSIPCTGTFRRLRGTAMRPVPMPNSSAGPDRASAARKLTVDSTRAGSKSSGHKVS